MSREIEGWFERPDGSEAPAVLRYSYEPRRPATHWEPASGGVEIEGLSIAGIDVDHNEPLYARLVDELTARAWAAAREPVEEDEEPNIVDDDLGVQYDEPDYGGAFDGNTVSSDAAVLRRERETQR